MSKEIKTEDIIKSLRMCQDPTVTRCDGCITKPSAGCYQSITSIAADRLEELNDFVSTAEKIVEEAAREKAPTLMEQLVKNHSCEPAKKANDPSHAIMQHAIDTYGRQAQTDVAMEEMAELTKVLLKTRRVPDDDHDSQQRAISSVIEEIADTEIMIDQLKIIYGAPYVDAVREQKLVRLEARLNDIGKEKVL